MTGGIMALTGERLCAVVGFIVLVVQANRCRRSRHGGAR
jgi:hypothetical protein